MFSSPFQNPGLARRSGSIEISGWAMEPMQWACGSGVISGYTDAAGNQTGELGPDDKCSRAQAATMMMRFDVGA